MIILAQEYSIEVKVIPARHSFDDNDDDDYEVIPSNQASTK